MDYIRSIKKEILIKSNGGGRDKGIDSLKAVSMIFVVILHSTFLGIFWEIVEVIARFAVPVFFMITGYYLYGADSQKIWKRTKKIVLLLVSSVALYVVYAFAFNRTVLLENLTISNFVSLIVLNVFPNALDGHLWYLFALLYCYLFILILKRFNLLDKRSLCFVWFLAITVSLSVILPTMGVIAPHITLYRNVYFTGYRL